MSPRRRAASIVPVVCRSIVFGRHLAVSRILAPRVMGWTHGRGTIDGLHQIAAVGADETAARSS